MKVFQQFKDLKMGAKFGVSFGLIGIMFIAVVWLYQSTLLKTQEGYGQVINGEEVMKTHALTIGNQMLQARRSEKDFLARKDLKYVDRVKSTVANLKAEAKAWKEISSNEEATKNIDKITENINEYLKSFLAVAAAWEVKGLDHKSGSRGELRSAAHDIEKRLEKFEVGPLKVTLLQIRRGEKDYMLRGQKKYIDKVHSLVAAFNQQVAVTSLDAESKRISDYNQGGDKGVIAGDTWLTAGDLRTTYNNNISVDQVAAGHGV